MRLFLIILMLFFTGGALFAQSDECPSDIPSNVPVMEEGLGNCTDCGACAGMNFELPEVEDVSIFENSVPGGDNMVFGIIPHEGIIADVENQYTPFTADQVLGVGEFIDANIDMAEFMDCVNLNCYSFAGNRLNGTINIGSEVLEGLNNLSPLSQEQIDDINASYEANSAEIGPIPDEYNSYYEWITSGDISNVMAEDLNDSVIEALSSNFAGCNVPGEPVDLNCMLERVFGQNTIDEGNNDCNYINQGIVSNPGAQGEEKMGFNVEGDVDIFSTRIPGTASDSPGSLSPGPSGMNILSNAVDNIGLYNGTVSTQVPLHTLVANDISLPISLSMNGNGVKVDAIGSEVGTNWNMSAGGAITRVVNNLPDEYVNTSGREVGHGRGPSTILKPCVTLDLGGLNFYCPPKRFEWNPMSPNVLRFNVNLGPPIVVWAGPVPVVLQFYFTIEVQLNIRMKPDYYSLTEKGVGYMHLDDPGKLSQVLSPAIAEKISINDFGSYSAEKRGKILAVANGKRRFEDQTFISSQLAVLVQYFQGISNLFGEENKVYTNLDLQADEFHYSFPGYSGTFVIDQNNNVHSRPANDLEIIPGKIIAENNEHHLSGFTVETPEGMVYTFGTPEGGGTSKLPGIEYSQHTSYLLPNYLTYPRNGDGTYSGALIDQSAYPFSASILCYPRALMYGSTYENLYTVQESPRFASTWKLTQVRSLLTRENVKLSYKSIPDLVYNSSKTIVHKVPNFAGSGDGSGFSGKINKDLNPFENSEYTNLKGEFNYSLTETTYNEQRLTDINTSRLESLKFKYEIPRQDIVGSELLQEVQVYRAGRFYKSYRLRYKDYAQNPVFGCTPTDIAEVPSTTSSFSFKFNDPHQKWHFDMGNLRMLTFRIGLECWPENAADAFDIVGDAIASGAVPGDVTTAGRKTFRIPLVLPTEPQERDNLNYLDEFGSISYVKVLEKKRANSANSMSSAEIDKEEKQFAGEGARSFLLGVEIIGNDGGSLPLVDFSYKGKLEQLPKRFSTQQDKWGYFNENKSNSFLPPLSYIDCNGEPVDINDEEDNFLDRHFDFLDIISDPSLAEFKNGQKQFGTLETSQVGALDRITYPTGGYVQFEYELNDVVEPDGSIVEGNGTGIRVLKKTEHASDDLSKTTSYVYKEPSVVNFPEQIIESPFARSDYDLSNLGSALEDIACSDNLENIENILGPISNNINIDFDECGATSGEILITTSSMAQNDWLMNGGAYVGYGNVIEILGEEGEGNGSIEHRFTTPQDIRSSLAITYHLSQSIRNIVDGGFWEDSGNSSAYIPPYAQLLTFSDRFGLETRANTYNQGGELVQSVVNKYNFETPDCKKIITNRSSVNGCSPTISIHSLAHDRRYPGDFLTNLVYGKLKSFVPQSAPVAIAFVELISNGLLGNHPYKQINRDYLYNEEQFIVDYARLYSSRVTNYFPEDGSYNWAETTVDYTNLAPSYGSNFVVRGSNTKFKNEQSQGVTNFYLGEGVSEEVIDGTTNNYLARFGEHGGFNSSIHTVSYTNGEKTGGQISGLRYRGNEGGQIVSYASWNFLSGQWQLAKYNTKWNEATLATKTFVGEYRNNLSFNPEIPTLFGAKTIDYDNNGYLRPEIVTVFDNNESGFFQRSYQYNDLLEVDSLIDENGILTEFEYDGFGRLKNKKSNNGRVINDYTYSYSPAQISSITSFTDGTPTQSVTESFNGLGMPTISASQDGTTISASTYDTQFRVSTSKSIGSALTTNTYEASPLGRMILSTQEDNTVSYNYTAQPSLEYDAHDFFQRIIVTDPNGHSSESVADGLGRTTVTKSAMGAETRYFFDAFGKPDNIVNPIKEEYSYGYNGFGGLTEKTVPNSAAEKKWYDHKYRLIASESSSGAVTTIKYDVFNRPFETYFYPEGGVNPGTPIIEPSPSLYQADALFTTTDYQNGKTWPREVKSRNLNEENELEGNITTTFTRDNIGRPTTTIVDYSEGPFSTNTITSNFNHANQILSTREVFSGDINIVVNNRTEYDDVLRPTESYLRLGNAPEYFLSRYVYSSEDQITTKFLGGTQNGDFLQRVTYTYDDLYRLVKINDPVDYSCLQQDVPTYCDFTAKYFVDFSTKCSRVTGIIIDNELINFTQPVSLLSQSSASNLLEEINTIFASRGLDAEFYQTAETDNVSGYEYVFSVSNLDANQFSLVFGQQNCNFNVEFIRENCCTPSNYFSENQTPWLGTSNSPDLYFQEMSYDGLDIEWIKYSGDCYLGQTQYDFTYDADHRIKTADHTIFQPNGNEIKDAYNANYSYDLAGNILTLNRYGRYDQTALPVTALYGQIDKLVYKYETNSTAIPHTSKLESVTDQISGTAQEYGYKPQTSEYGYDGAGNMTGGGGNTLFYNGFNFPKEIQGGGVTHKITYTASGTPFRRTTDSPNADPQVQNRYFISGFEVVDDKIEFYNHGAGRIVFEEDSEEQHAQYRISDHLGNTVVLFEDKNENGVVEENPSNASGSEVLQRELYYPFGMQLRGTAPLNPDPSQNYLFNGIEKLEGTEIYQAFYRSYDPAIGRWLQIDPKSESFASMSSYTGMGNIPTKYNDVLGDSIWLDTYEGVDADLNNQTHNIFRGDIKVLDLTGDIDVNKMAKSIEAELKRIMSKREGAVSYSSSIKVTGVSSMADVSESDHLLVYVDNVKPDGQMNKAGTAPIGGLIAYYEGGGDELFGGSIHEVLHTFGLHHPWQSDLYPSNTGRYDNGNYMSYGVRSYLDFKQLVRIHSLINTPNKVNLDGNRSTSTFTYTSPIFWRRASTNRNPYYRKVKKGEIIPLILDPIY